MSELITIDRGEIRPQDITEELYIRWTNYIDASDKTIQTYTRDLRRMFRYFAEHGIRQP